MTNKELQAQLDAIEDVVKRKDGETVVEAVTRIVAAAPSGKAKETIDYLQSELEGANRRIAILEKAANPIITTDGTPIPFHPSQVPDDEPLDPRPSFDPALGWQTPSVIEWANRRRKTQTAAN